MIGGKGVSRVLSVAVLAAALVVSACQSSKNAEEIAAEVPEGPYEYPISDPFAATIIGTPGPYRAILPEKIRRQDLRLKVFKDREIPEVFWYDQGLQISLAYQKKRAPLIFNIAGTGASHDSRLMRVMEKAFFQGGFHVASLPSPTALNFIINASSTSVPGRIVEDGRDLYRVMQIAYERIKRRADVSDVYLTGYSLGGWQAAFVAKLDDKEDAIGFKKVLMVNPPVSLFDSIRILDGMLDDNVPGGPSNIGPFVEQTFAAFAEVFGEEGEAGFDSDFLFEAYAERAPPDEQLAALIGLAFRLSSGNLVFTADVMSNSGYVVPKNAELSSTSSLTEYFKVVSRIGFEQYLNELLYPYYRELEPGLTKEDLIDEASLRSIEDYLRRDAKIGLMTNEDDIILAPGDLDYLRDVFDGRAQIYPTGGHMGNLQESNFLRTMVRFFQT